MRRIAARLDRMTTPPGNKSIYACGCFFIKEPCGCAMLQELVASLTAAFRLPICCCTLPSTCLPG